MCNVNVTNQECRIYYVIVIIIDFGGYSKNILFIFSTDITKMLSTHIHTLMVAFSVSRQDTSTRKRAKQESNMRILLSKVNHSSPVPQPPQKKENFQVLCKSLHEFPSCLRAEINNNYQQFVFNKILLTNISRKISQQL